MQVKAKKNLIYKGEIYTAGEKFECEEFEELKKRGLIEEEVLPTLEEEIKRKKR